MSSASHLRAVQLRREDLLAASAQRRLIAQYRTHGTAEPIRRRMVTGWVGGGARLSAGYRWRWFPDWWYLVR